MPSRRYDSPLRAGQAQETRARILSAALDLMVTAPEGDEIGLDRIAAHAGVERRTLFRHFDTREALFAAAFDVLNARLGLSRYPADTTGLLAGPPAAFAAFDGHEGAIRAAIHTRAGRTMREGMLPERRAAFAALLDRHAPDLPPDCRAEVLALIHLLYSAPAWEVLKDYGGLTGAQAGRAAAWALSLILSAVGEGTTEADFSDKGKDHADDRI